MVRVTLFIFALLIATSAVTATAPPPVEADSTATIKKLVEALKDPDPDVRANCAMALVKCGTDAIEPLIEALKSDHSERKAGAAYTLGLMGAPARAAMPALLEALKDDNLEVRRAASGAVAKMIPDKSKPARGPDKP